MVLEYMLIYVFLLGAEPITRVEFFNTESECIEESRAIAPLVESADCWTLEIR